MKTIVLYYSLMNHTRAAAQSLAETEQAELAEVKEVRKRGVLGAILPGCLHALQGKPSAILPLPCDLNAYDRILLGAPVWAKSPAPAFHALVALLPPGKDVGVFLCSDSGDTAKSRPRTEGAIAARHCRLAFYRDIAQKK